MLQTLLVGGLHEALQQQHQILLELKACHTVHHAPHIKVVERTHNHCEEEEEEGGK